MSDTNELKRIDLEIMERLLLVLYESGRSKRTTIARNAGMSYDKGVKYLDCLEVLGFVKRQEDYGYVTFDLTPQGISFCKRKLGVAFSKKYEESMLR